MLGKQSICLNSSLGLAQIPFQYPKLSVEFHLESDKRKQMLSRQVLT